MPTIGGFAITLGSRIRETTQTTGTGTYALDGARPGKRTFVAGVGSGLRTLYVVELGTNWEIGVGTITSGAPSTVSRDLILASSNSGTAVSWPPGTKDIFCDVSAGLANQIYETPMASIKRTIFTASDTWTRDAKCLQVRISGVGNGGAGGGSSATGAGESADGGGGGGGEYAEAIFSAAAAGASLAVTIPAAALGVDGGNGNNGGTVTVGAGPLISFAGGSGGSVGPDTTGSNNGPGGDGGTGGVGGGLRVRGSDGGRGRVNQGIANFSGYGGGSHLGGARQSNGAGNGLAGRDWGGGGSGAAAGPTEAAHTGGNGAKGIVIFEEYLSP